MRGPYLLILIAWALLLSGATNSVTNSPNRRCESKSTAENKYPPSTPPTPSFSNQRNPDDASNHGKRETYNYYGNFNYVPEKPSATVTHFLGPS